jgi:hypothetical protein
VSLPSIVTTPGVAFCLNSLQDITTQYKQAAAYLSGAEHRIHMRWLPDISGQTEAVHASSERSLTSLIILPPQPLYTFISSNSDPSSPASYFILLILIHHHQCLVYCNLPLIISSIITIIIIALFLHSSDSNSSSSPSPSRHRLLSLL